MEDEDFCPDTEGYSMIKKLILIIFLALVIFSAIYALWDRRDYTTSSEKAYQAFMSGENLRMKLYYRDAIPEYEKAVKLDSNFAMAYCRLAEMYREFDNKDKVQQNIDKAIALFPKITKKEQLLIQITKSNFNKENFEDNEYVNEFIKLYPDDIMSHTYLASKYMGMLQYDKAIAEYEIIIDEEPGSALPYNMLGYLNYWAGHYDEALSYIKKYSMIGGKQANPHDSYGEILMYMGRYDEAIKEFEAANRIKPDLDFVLQHLGQAYRAIGRFRDAIGFFERAKEFSRSPIFAARIDEDIAYAYYFSGKNEMAIKILTDMHKAHPEWYSVSTLLGWISADSGDTIKADECLSDLEKTMGTSADSVRSSMEKISMGVNRDILTAKIAQEKGDNDKAIALYNKAINLSTRPDIIMLKALLADLYIKVGKNDEALPLLLANLNDNPNHTLSLYLSAKAYKSQGDKEKQKQMLLTYLSVMSGADDDVEDVVEARAELDSLMGNSGS